MGLVQGRILQEEHHNTARPNLAPATADSTLLGVNKQDMACL